VCRNLDVMKRQLAAITGHDGRLAPGRPWVAHFGGARTGRSLLRPNVGPLRCATLGTSMKRQLPSS